MANWASIANVGDPLSPGWQEKNLTWIEPIKGQRWQVYRPAQAAFEGLLTDLAKLGYTPTSSGGFNYRNIRGSDKLSQHAFGTAIDLNSLTNPMGQSATDIPHAAELAKKWGLEWGGNWKGRPDPMHFEYTGGGGNDTLVGSAGGDTAAAVPWTIDPKWPAGMRNNNPGNIKYVGQPGTTASANTDQGDPQAVYGSPQAGMRAMYELLLKKYGGGKLTANDIIAAQGGWTPGNTQAAANIAKYAGIRPDEDIRLSDPASAAKFMRALMRQEHGDASSAYTDQMIMDAISGKAAPTPETTAAGGGVRHPPNPKVGSMEDARTLIASGQMAPVPAQQDDDEPPAWGRRIADALGGMGSPWGGGGGMGGGGIPRLSAYAPPAAEPAPIVAPNAAVENQRNMLAALMQKYWVG